jgi:SNF2 family DNA or RNA helicase
MGADADILPACTPFEDHARGVQIVRTEFKPTIPSLVVVPNSSLSYWKGELEYWLNDEVEVVFYTGPPGARGMIAANEFWLLPGALDGKVPDPRERLARKVPKPHVVLISMESLHQVRRHATPAT